MLYFAAKRWVRHLVKIHLLIYVFENISFWFTWLKRFKMLPRCLRNLVFQVVFHNYLFSFLDLRAWIGRSHLWVQFFDIDLLYEITQIIFDSKMSLREVGFQIPCVCEASSFKMRLEWFSVSHRISDILQRVLSFLVAEGVDVSLVQRWERSTGVSPTFAEMSWFCKIWWRNSNNIFFIDFVIHVSDIYLKMWKLIIIQI